MWENDYQFKTCSCRSVIGIRYMAPLFSKADLNKFWHDVQNEATLIYAKFGKDLSSISKIISRKTKWPRFSGLPCIIYHRISRNGLKLGLCSHSFCGISFFHSCRVWRTPPPERGRPNDRKSHMRLRLTSTLMTSDDLVLLVRISRDLEDLGANNEIDPYCQRRNNSPSNVLHSGVYRLRWYRRAFLR